MKRVLTLSAVAVLAAGCAQMDMGNTGAKTVATGSVGGSESQNANGKLEHCSKTLGTVAVEEDTSQPWFVSLQQYQLGPTTPVLKLLLQQSGCFVVVERGKAMRNMQQERELAESGELRKTSKMHKGQMVAADYVLSPSVTFANNNAGGVSGVVGGLLGPVGALVAGSMHSKEASTMLTLVDSRSGVQLAASEGSARNMDFGALGGLFGGVGGAALGGYSNTAEGKVVVAAFTDSLNGLVKAVRSYKAQEVEGGLGNGGNLKVN
jgi:curli biogenesis system outer membrane secretion channel CsgG